MRREIIEVEKMNRITLPNDVMKVLRLSVGDKIDIQYDLNTVIIRRYGNKCFICGEIEKLNEMGNKIFMCDKCLEAVGRSVKENGIL